MKFRDWLDGHMAFIIIMVFIVLMGFVLNTGGYSGGEYGTRNYG